MPARTWLCSTDGSGTVDTPEFIKFALRDALSRTSVPVSDLFLSWDEDGNLKIDMHEFRAAVRYFGFEALDGEVRAGGY